MLGIGPCTAGAIETVRLVCLEERRGSLSDDLLMGQGLGDGPKGSPTACWVVVAFNTFWPLILHARSSLPLEPDARGGQQHAVVRSEKASVTRRYCKKTPPSLVTEPRTGAL
jgi:hypothetical protein